MDFDIIKSMYMMNRIHFIGAQREEGRGGERILYF